MNGILFAARLGSSRLPKKHLIEVNNKSFIEWLIMRFINEFKKEIENDEVKLIIATSDEPVNEKFETLLAPYGVSVFYGSISNIPLRYLNCGEFYNLSNIISIDGDDILCSTNGARVVYENFLKHPEKDIISVTGLPLGMNSSGYKVSYLKKCLSLFSQKKAEVGWGRIFVNPDKLEVKIGDWDIYDKLRFTLDYDDDALFFYEVINYLKEEVVKISDDKLINVVQQKQFNKINSHLFDIYWDNYNSSKESEDENG
jgi:spore coat polysaccharide biosynthesis protein SpsF